MQCLLSLIAEFKEDYSSPTSLRFTYLAKADF